MPARLAELISWSDRRRTLMACRAPALHSADLCSSHAAAAQLLGSPGPGRGSPAVTRPRCMGRVRRGSLATTATTVPASAVLILRSSEWVEVIAALSSAFR